MKWKCEITDQAITTSPTIDAEGAIYIGTSNGNFYTNTKNYKFYAISPNGDIVWEYQTGDPINFSPVLGSDGTIYLGSDQYELFAFKGKGGPANSSWPMFGHDSRHTGCK